MNKDKSFFFKYLRLFTDLIRTFLLWIYFIAGFVIFFAPFYIAAFIFIKKKERAFQNLNSIFFTIFFKFAELIIPGLSFNIPDDVKAIKSSIIICNHLSYLDPLLMISLYKKQKTIVKDTFFHVPIFGLVLKAAAYIPSSPKGKWGYMMSYKIDALKEYILSEGNIFIFPEGTRSKNGSIGAFSKGAFKIAKMCNAPIYVLKIANTNNLFPPGKFLFNTSGKNRIEIKLMDKIHPDYNAPDFKLSIIMNRARTLLRNKDM